MLNRLARFASAFLDQHGRAEDLAYRRLRSKGFEPASIIDVGAYEGSWTRLVRAVFPGVPVLMVEAQSSKRPFLEKVTRDLSDVRFEQALLGREQGKKVQFFEMGTGSSMFSENSNVDRRALDLTTVTLDEIAGSIAQPALMKIDVQGAEIEVLEGAPKTLAACEFVQLEVALLPYNDGAPTLIEVLDYMAEKDFVPFDVSGMCRPNGVDLAQLDLLFTRDSSRFRHRFFEF